MTTRVGIGYSEDPDSFAAAQEVTQQALARSGVESAELLLLFHTAKQDPHEFHRGVRSTVGDDTRLFFNDQVLQQGQPSSSTTSNPRMLQL